MFGEPKKVGVEAKKVEVDHAKAQEKAKRRGAQSNFESHSQPEEEYYSSDYEENNSTNSISCYEEAVELQLSKDAAKQA